MAIMVAMIACIARGARILGVKALQSKGLVIDGSFSTDHIGCHGLRDPGIGLVNIPLKEASHNCPEG